MTSPLRFFHVGKVANLTQIREIYSRPYLHMCISVSKSVGNIDIAVFASRAVFARLRLLNIITNRDIYFFGVFQKREVWSWEKLPALYLKSEYLCLGENARHNYSDFKYKAGSFSHDRTSRF